MPVASFYRNLNLVMSANGPGWLGDSNVSPDGTHVISKSAFGILRNCGATPDSDGLPLPSGTRLCIEHNGEAFVRLVRYATGWETPEYCDEAFLSGSGTIVFSIPEDCVAVEFDPVGSFSVSRIALEG